MADVVISNNKYTVDSLYQWDLNQTLTIYGVSLASAPEIHFANNAMKMAIVRQSKMDSTGVIRVEVPNSLLQKPNDINVYVCTQTGDKFNSLYKIVIPVVKRAQPGDYEYTVEYETYSIERINVEVIALDPDADATVEKVVKDDKVVSLRFGIPRGVQGIQGNPGPQGKPFTYEDFTPEQLEALRGPKGDPFEYEDFTSDQLESLRGPKGDSPVKGVDYWTSTDKNEIVNDVLDSLPVAEEVSF